MTERMFSQAYDGKWDRESLDYLALYNEWHVVSRSEDVGSDKPVPVKLLGHKLALWRSENDVINVWLDYCAHRGAPLSLGTVKGCHLVCPYHGWEFNEMGDCVHVPAHPDSRPTQKKIVQRHRAEDRYGFIWVCLGEPRTAIPRLPHWDDKDFRKVAAGPYPGGFKSEVQRLKV